MQQAPWFDEYIEAIIKAKFTWINLLFIQVTLAGWTILFTSDDCMIITRENNQEMLDLKEKRKKT